MLVGGLSVKSAVLMNDCSLCRQFFKCLFFLDFTVFLNTDSVNIVRNVHSRTWADYRAMCTFGLCISVIQDMVVVA